MLSAFTVPAAFDKFAFGTYALLTALGVAGAAATWAAVARLSSRPKWVLTRLAALVTALFLIPDFLLLGTPGNPAGNGSQPAGVNCNKIPLGLINPIAQQLIALYPEPNANNPSNFTNFVSEPVRSLDETKFDIRLDHNFSGNDNAFARFSYDQASSYVPGGGGIGNFTEAGFFASNQGILNHGRNIALLSKAAVYAATRNISRIVLAPLAGNPFPDATPQFLKALSAVLSLGLDAPIHIAAPFSHLHKADVIKRGAELSVPFELTLSCMNPSGTEHCGLCSKCRERHDAFIEAGITDPTTYANPSPR